MNFISYRQQPIPRRAQELQAQRAPAHLESTAMNDLIRAAQRALHFDTLGKLDERTARAIRFTHGEIAWVSAEAISDARQCGELAETRQRRTCHG